MSAPRLTRRLELQERADTPDGMGGYAVSWATLGTVWADMAPRTGRAELVAGRESARQPWRITVRGAPAGALQRPRPNQRFREGGRVFDILSVAEADGEGRFLICFAEEGLKV